MNSLSSFKISLKLKLNLIFKLCFPSYCVYGYAGTNAVSFYVYGIKWRFIKTLSISII